MSRFSKVNGSWTPTKMSIRSSGTYHPSATESVRSNDTWKQYHVEVKNTLAEMTLKNVTTTAKTTTLTFTSAKMAVVGKLIIDGVITATYDWTTTTGANIDRAITIPANTTAKLILEGTANNHSTNYASFQFTVNDLVESMDHLHLVNYQLNSYPKLNSTRLKTVPNSIPPSISVLSATFVGCPNLDCPLDKWDTKNVTTMTQVFQDTKIFNRPLATWNTSKVTNMFWMFKGASAFNQNLTGWDVTKVTSWTDFRVGSALSTANTPVKFR